MKIRVYTILAILFGLCLSTPAFAAIKLKAVVDKSEQRMRVYDGDGNQLYSWCASTGKVSAYSRTGPFHPHKFRPGEHISGTYGTKMIDSVYYDKDRAVHGVDDAENVAALCNYGTSYGCTHISAENAHIFYNMASKLKHSEVLIVVQN